MLHRLLKLARSNPRWRLPSKSTLRKLAGERYEIIRSGKLAGSLESIRPLEKRELTSVSCPSAERLGTTVLHFLSAQPRPPELKGSAGASRHGVLGMAE